MKKYMFLLVADLTAIGLFFINSNIEYSRYLRYGGKPVYFQNFLSILIPAAIVSIFIFFRIFRNLKIQLSSGNYEMTSPFYAGLVTLLSLGFCIPAISDIPHVSFILIPFSFIFSRSNADSTNYKKIKKVVWLLLVLVFVLFFVFLFIPEYSTAGQEGKSYAGFALMVVVFILVVFGTIMHAILNKLESRSKKIQNTPL